VGSQSKSIYYCKSFFLVFIVSKKREEQLVCALDVMIHLVIGFFHENK